MENKLTNRTKAMSIFWWTIRRYIPVSIAYWVVLFISLPVVELFAGVMGSAVIALENDGIFRVDFKEYVEILSETVPYLVGTEFAFASVVFTTIISMIAFSYMHNKRCVDFFGSLPVSRKTMFFARFIAVVVLAVVPVIVFGTIGAVLTFNLPTMWEVFKTIIYIIIAVVGNISIVGFLSLCCGSTVDIIISYIGINVGYPICVALLNAFPQVVIPGLGDDIWPASVYTLGCPVASVFTMTYGNDKWLGVIWWVLMIVVLVFANIALCNKRKAEMAQDTYTFSVVEYVVKFVICTLAGFGLGWIFSLAGLVFGTVIAQYIFFVIGLLIGVMVANLLLHLIYHRGLAQYAKSLIECALVTIVCMLYVGAVGSGLWGTDADMPRLTDIESVSLTDGYENTFYVKGVNILTTHKSDDDIINGIYDTHKDIIAKNIDVKEAGLYPLSGVALYHETKTEDYDLYVEYSSADITYKLKNGKEFTRYYTYEELHDIDIQDNLYTGSNDVDYLNTIPVDYVSGVSVYMGSDEYYGSSSIYLYDSKQKFETIVEALKKDIETVGKLDAENSTYVVEIEYEDKDYNWVYATININETYVNTIAALEDAGYSNLDMELLENGYYYSTDEYITLEQGIDIYFNLPEGMDPNKEIFCMQGFNWSGEYIALPGNEKTKCEKVDEDTWKYTVYECDEYKNRKKTFMICQETENSVLTTGPIPMPKDETVNVLSIGEKALYEDGKGLSNKFEIPIYEYEWSYVEEVEATEN